MLVEDVVLILQDIVEDPFRDEGEVSLFEVKGILNDYMETDCNGCEYQDIGFISLYIDAVDQLEEQYANILLNIQSVERRQEQLDGLKAEIEDYLTPLIRYLRDIDLRVKGATAVSYTHLTLPTIYSV